MKRILREPLIHFLLLGAVLFGSYGILNQDEASAPDEIVVTAGQVESLAANFTKVRHRVPRPEELQELIDDYVREEILNRKAIELGLDRDDTIIRQRLQQKMEFVAEDFAARVEPTEQELTDYLSDHPEEFREDARFTFRQVYLNPEAHGDQFDAHADALLMALKKAGPQADVSQLGESLMLPRDYTLETQTAVAAQFGQPFAEELMKLPLGEWSGPVFSDYGRHLVLITERREAHLPALGEVRARLKRKLTYARREEASRRFLESLLADFRVIVQWPPSDPEPETGRQAEETLQ